MNYQAVILAAGKGTRMGDSTIPKVLHSLHGKPLIAHALANIERLEDTIRPIMVVGFMREKIMAELGDNYTYAVQEEQLGTAHAVLSTKPYVTAKNIIVIYGDMPFVSTKSLQDLMRHHDETGNKISLFTTIVPNFEGRHACFNGYGRILRNDRGAILGIREYKDATPEERAIREVNPGIYIFNSEWLWKNSEKLNNKNAQGEYYLTDMISIAIEAGDAVSFLEIPTSEVFGINTKDELEVAHSLELAWE